MLTDTVRIGFKSNARQMSFIIDTYEVVLLLPMRIEFKENPSVDLHIQVCIRIEY